MLRFAVWLLCMLVAGACLWLAHRLLQRLRAPRRRAVAPVVVDVAPPPAEPLLTPIVERESATAMFMVEDLFPTPAPSDEARTELIPHALVLAQQRAMASASASQTGRPYVHQPIVHDQVDPLAEALDMAGRALLRWRAARDRLTLQQLADGPEPLLDNALSPLLDAGDEACERLLEPTLARSEAKSEQRCAAALALLRHDGRRALPCFDRLLSDVELGPWLREILSWWRVRERDALLRERAELAKATRDIWLELLALHRVDPGPALLAELAHAEAPELRLHALRLAKFHTDAEQRQTLAQAHLADAHPQLRMAAIELALFDRDPAAWQLCEDLAHTEPRALELCACLGGPRSFAKLMHDHPEPDSAQLWPLCMSGRPAAAALAARRLQDTRGDALANTALRYVIGNPEGNDASAHVLLRHWARRAPELLDDPHRYLHDHLMGGTASIRACLSSRDDRHHRAFADELWFRSRGKVRWIGRGFAGDTLAGIKAVGTPNIDFESDYGPG